MNLNAVRRAIAIAGGSTTTFLTNGLFGGADDHNGKWLLGTGGHNIGTQFRVTNSAYAAPTTTLTFYPAGTSVVTADTAELWEGKYEPTRINEFINQAIIEVTGLAFDPEESLALHGDGRQRRFDIPDEFAMIDGIYQRASVKGVQIHDATTEWDEAAAPSNITRVVDTEDYKKVPASNKFSVAAAFTTGLVSSKDISSLDLSGYDYVEFWIKSTIATIATTLTLLLDDNAACVSATETITIPALVADTWTFVRTALSNPELDTAIISVGLNIAVDTFAAVDGVIWINDVMTVKDETALWDKIDNNSWHVDEEAADIIFRSAPAYKLLKLTGGDKPALFTLAATAAGEAETCEIDDQFVIARATELALLSAGGGPGTDPDALRSLASYWRSKADQTKRSLPWLVGTRMVG